MVNGHDREGLSSLKAALEPVEATVESGFALVEPGTAPVESGGAPIMSGSSGSCLALNPEGGRFALFIEACFSAQCLKCSGTSTGNMY